MAQSDVTELDQEGDHAKRDQQHPADPRTAESEREPVDYGCQEHPPSEPLVVADELIGGDRSSTNASSESRRLLRGDLLDA